MNSYQGALFDDSFFGHWNQSRFCGVVIVFIRRPALLNLDGRNKGMKIYQSEHYEIFGLYRKPSDRTCVNDSLSVGYA